MQTKFDKTSKGLETRSQRFHAFRTLCIYHLTPTNSGELPGRGA